eukprot:scaffold61920_cov23-Cyclotella_meneghiniana.AAC.1
MPARSQDRRGRPGPGRQATIGAQFSRYGRYRGLLRSGPPPGVQSLSRFSTSRNTSMERITPVAVHAAIDKAAADKAVAEAEAARLVAKRAVYDRAEELELQPYIAKTTKLLPELQGRLQAYIDCDLGPIHQQMGLDHFLIGGSWASAIIAKVVSEWTHCEDLREFNKLELVANNIDLFSRYIKKYSVDGLFWELNTVKCGSCSAAGFLENNDINVIASCLEVDLSCDQSFLFSSESDRTIELVDTYDFSKYSATTCVRLAYKHFQMPMFNLDTGNVDPTTGTLASSQKEKLDKMKAWDNNPLKAYDCKKKKSKNYYFLVAKDNALVCVDCRSSRERETCKCKDHLKGMKVRKQKVLEELAEAGILDEVDMEEMIEEEMIIFKWSNMLTAEPHSYHIILSVVVKFHLEAEMGKHRGGPLPTLVYQN